jgi:hypothetical protein
VRDVSTETLAAVGSNSSVVTPLAAALVSTVPVAPGDESISVALPKAGDRVAQRFTIGKLLGRGGMGYVFQATDDELGIE